jgi:hypothetical protein
VLIKKTEVNPEKVIDLAFSIRDAAQDYISSGMLQVEFEHGEKELYYRFLKNFPNVIEFKNHRLSRH